MSDHPNGDPMADPKTVTVKDPETGEYHKRPWDDLDAEDQAERRVYRKLQLEIAERQMNWVTAALDAQSRQGVLDLELLKTHSALAERLRRA